MAHPVPQALVVVENGCRAKMADDEQRVRTALGGHREEVSVPDLVEGVRQHGRLTLNFHPDRRSREGHTVAAGLLETGRYQPQTETGVSNGSRSAVPEGERTQWERTLFGAAYVDSAVTRPVYGALDLTRDPHGGSPRFGSSFVILAASCLDRATFCVGDSHVGPTDLGTIECFTAILAGLLEQGADDAGLGRSLSVGDIVTAIQQGEPTVAPARCLDGYIEAQVHGDVLLGDDVDAIVLDPSFRGTPTETLLDLAADQHQFELMWHGGSELAATLVPDDFRGPTMPELAQLVARADGIVDAACLGRCAENIAYTPPTRSGDAPESPLQQVKYLWHCLLHHGRDAERASG
ncbi:MAG: DUF3626 domain-containing protein [Acidimicrobiales bacterium]